MNAKLYKALVNTAAIGAAIPSYDELMSGQAERSQARDRSAYNSGRAHGAKQFKKDKKSRKTASASRAKNRGR